MTENNLQPEAIKKLQGHLEQVFSALEMGSESKHKFRDLLDSLSEAMNFELIPPKDIQEAIKQLKEKIDMEVTELLNMDLDRVTAHQWYLSQMYQMISAKQAWCDGRSVQLKYAVKMNEAGVTWSLSKKASTLAERIQKGLTNPDKEAIAQMITVKEGQMEVYFYFVSRLLKGLMDCIYQQQNILSNRYQKLLSEWKTKNIREGYDGRNVIRRTGS